MGRVMALWCRDLRRVTVTPSTETKTVTLVVPFYENHEFLRRQIQGWLSYAGDLRWLLRIIVVDDGSHVPAAIESGLPLNIRLFRIETDVRWNWLAARNIGAHHAPDGWLLMTDMDHVVPETTLRAVLHGQHDPTTIYAFSRREHTGAVATPHSASFLLTRELFWRVGGYDETLSGFYGTDGDWRRRCAAVAPMAVLNDELIRHEYVADASTQRYQRKQPEDARVRQLIAARGTQWRPKTLSYPYHEVAL